MPWESRLDATAQVKGFSSPGDDYLVTMNGLFLGALVSDDSSLLPGAAEELEVMLCIVVGGNVAGKQQVPLHAIQ